MPTFRIKEAAALLGVSDDTIRRRVDAGRISPASDGSGRLAVDGASLARFAQEHAEAAARPPEAGSGSQSLRNRFPGLVTRVVKDTVMAQVEIQAGTHRSVSLLSREAADELAWSHECWPSPPSSRPTYQSRSRSRLTRAAGHLARALAVRQAPKDLRRPVAGPGANQPSR